MTYPHQPENIKVCPGCGTNLIHTAKHCAICGYRFAEVDLKPVKKEEPGKPEGRPERREPFRLMPITLSLPILVGLILLVLAMNALITVGLQKRIQTKTLVAAAQSTATYIATTYVSPTPSPTETRTPAPPTETPVVDIEYTVVSGDSCLSIVKKFSVGLDVLLRKNDIDCAVLKIGTVLRIPPPTPTPEPANEVTNTVTPKAAP